MCVYNKIEVTVKFFLSLGSLNSLNSFWKVCIGEALFTNWTNWGLLTLRTIWVI